MKRLLLLSLSVGVLSCGGSSTREFSRNDLQLVTAHYARDLCTCRFVMEMDEAFCNAWVKASPSVSRASVDVVNKTTEASAFLLWSAHARFVSDKFGCVLE